MASMKRVSAGDVENVLLIQSFTDVKSHRSFLPVISFLFKDASSPESLITKVSWMAFLLFLFYISFEIFLRLDKSKRTLEAGNSEL